MLDKELLKQEVDNVINWIRDYVKNANAKGIVIGCSGGKDSATVLALAVKAIGKENVLAVAIPCNSNKKDLEDAVITANAFGVQLITIDISKNYELLNENIEEAIKENLTKQSQINVIPRLRMTTLYAIAQNLGYLVIGTGNLCERIVGYTTKWGDSACDFNPIGNFTVDEVLQIGKYLNVPDKIINKAPNDGLSNQTDEEKLGIKYSQISEYIRTGKTDTNSIKKIDNLYKLSKHKREKIPTYIPKDFKNYLNL